MSISNDPLTSNPPTLSSASSDRSGDMAPPQSEDRIQRWASSAHQTIDRIESRLSRTRDSAASVVARPRAYGQQARQYQHQLTDRVKDKPLQTAGAVFAAGVVLGKLFMRRTKVDVVKVPLYVPSLSEADKAAVRARANQWREAASAAARRLGEASQHGAHQAGAATLAGLATAKAASSKLWDQTRKAMPPDLSTARQQAAAKTQYYGDATRHQLEQHPMPGLAVAVGLGAIASALVLGASSRRDLSDSDRSLPVVRAVDKEGTPFKEQWREDETSRLAGMGAPIASGALVLGLGVVLGALLMRR